jgi:hypothetical protein
VCEALNVQSDPWRAVPGGDETIAALKVAREVANRLQDPNQTEVATAAVSQQLQRLAKDCTKLLTLLFFSDRVEII